MAVLVPSPLLSLHQLYFDSLNLNEYKILTIPSVGEDVGELKLSYAAGGNVMVQPL